MTMQIKLTKSQIALVDDRDYAYLSQFKWYAKYAIKSKTYYGASTITYYENSIRKQRQITMHRVIMSARKGQIVDHINHSGVDNRRDNLRFVTELENTKNMRISSRNKSGFVGISFRKNRGTWLAMIQVNRKLINLGTFRDKEKAIERRKMANIEYGFHENHGLCFGEKL